MAVFQQKAGHQWANRTYTASAVILWRRKEIEDRQKLYDPLSQAEIICLFLFFICGRHSLILVSTTAVTEGHEFDSRPGLKFFL